MKIALLTMFNGLSSTYSLVNVVKEQLKMLLDANIEVKMLVSEDCPDNEREGIFLDKRIEWIKVINHLNGQLIHWRDYSDPTMNVHKSFFDEVKVIAKDFETYLSDVDFCFLHDIHYQGWHLVHNVAIREAQKNLPNVRFLAFTHSAPVNRPLSVKWPLSARYTPMPKTTYIYPTISGLPALAKQYNIAEGRCRAVNNSLDFLSSMCQVVQNLSNKIDLLSPEIIIVYPGRLTPGKKFEKVTALAGCIKRTCEMSVKVIFCDFPSADIKSDTYKKIIINAGVSTGLSSEDISFTSDLGYPQGIPREAVLDLFTISNLFICPSFSESFGLTVLEAASRGNFIVVNECVPALAELSKQLKTYTMRWDARNFGFDTHENYHPSEVDYYDEHALRIVNLMREDIALNSKTISRIRYNPKWIWENQLLPLMD